MALVRKDGNEYYLTDTRDMDALVDLLIYHGFYELPRVRSFGLARIPGDKQSAFLNIRVKDGRIRLGGTDSDTARELLHLLTTEGEVTV